MQADKAKNENYGSETYAPKNEKREIRTGMVQIPPFSLSVKDASEHFGLAPQTLYNYISTGRLHRGVHYLKFGGKVLIVRDEFIEFMREEDGSQDRKKDQHAFH